MSGGMSSDPAETGDGAPGAGLVLGTAGHIDHGKTALVRALTGIDTDRLPEEKARGITIDLGFAALELGDGRRLSVVDVPGHERLVRTMVSGASGIDLVLLVIAADEGVMPQTREHVAICDLLGIERGVVALTKSDIADEDVAELAAEEARELLEDTSLAGATVVPVSSLTGDGIDTLRDELSKLVAGTRARTPRGGPPRLGIDRVFAVRGFGTVATGTLVGDELRVGDTVEVHPTELRARIRGLQTHGEAADRVAPGARCAVNLQGIEVADLSRGEVISSADGLAPTRTVDVELWWLPSSPESEDIVSVEFLVGTAERRARLATIGASHFVPGSRGFARIHVDGDPVPLLPGDRFIVRGFARTEGAGGTLGGGVVLDVAPPHRRRSDPELLRELEIFAQHDERSSLRERVLRAGLGGVTREGLERETGLRGGDLSEHLDALSAEGVVIAAGGQRWIGSAVVSRLEERLAETLDAFHASEPLRPGMSRSALRGVLPDNVERETAELALSRLEASGRIEFSHDVARRAGFSPTLDDETRAFVERIATEADEAGLEPPSPRDWAEQLGVSLERLRDLLAHLEREDVLVRAPGDLWFHRDAIASLRQKLVDHLEAHGEIDTQSYKALIGTSRRTAMPLMELFDELHVTRRRGDVRIAR